MCGSSWRAECERQARARRGSARMTHRTSRGGRRATARTRVDTHAQGATWSFEAKKSCRISPPPPRWTDQLEGVLALLRTCQGCGAGARGAGDNPRRRRPTRNKSKPASSTSSDSFGGGRHTASEPKTKPHRACESNPTQRRILTQRDSAPRKRQVRRDIKQQVRITRKTTTTTTQTSLTSSHHENCCRLKSEADCERDSSSGAQGALQPGRAGTSNKAVSSREPDKVVLATSPSLIISPSRERGR